LSRSRADSSGPRCSSRTLWRDGILDGRRLAAVIASGVALHVVLAGGVLAYGRGLIPRDANLAIQLANGFVPLVFAIIVRKPAR